MPETDFLSFPCKRSDRVDLKTPLGKYVKNIYGSEQLEDILQDVEEVSRRRNEAVAVSGGGASEGAKEILASYYRALCVMETRFPITRDPGHAQVPFWWSNALNPRRKTKQMNIHFEKSAILFNMAAHLTQQAANQNRESREGYKAAISHFKEAAGLFALTREIALKVENPKPADLTTDFLTMAEKLVLAQGQEAVFWKAKSDGTSPPVLSRVAKQASILYAQTLGFFTTPSVKEDMDKSWQGLIQSKSWLFEALCQSNAAQGAKERDDIAVEISRLGQAVMLLENLAKSGKFLSPALPSLVEELLSTTNRRLYAAERDNSSVYLKKIPPFNELPAITGAELVKPVECSVLDASKEHIFEDLVPEHIMKALSRYSELVDTKLRKQFEKLNGATDDCRVFLKQYELPELLDSVNNIGVNLLPEGIKKDLEDIAQCDGVEQIEKLQSTLTEMKEAAKTDLEKLQKDLDDEAAQDQEMRKKYGELWTPPTSISQTAGMKKSIETYTEQLYKADVSDRVIQASVENNKEKFQILSVEAFVQKMPKLEAGMVSTTDLEPQTIVANIRNSLDQLEAMASERGGLEESLKSTKDSENLLPKLLAIGVGSHEELFGTELKKYDQLVADVDENLRNQKELINYIRTALEDFKQTFDIPGWKQKTEVFMRDAKASISQFYDVRTQVSSGMRFYIDIKNAIDILKRHVGDYVMARTIDREDRIEMIRAKERSQSNAPPMPPEPQPYVPAPVPPQEVSNPSLPPAPPSISPAVPQEAARQGFVSYSSESIGTGQQGQHQSIYHSTQSPSPPPSGYEPMMESPNPYVSTEPSAPPPSHYYSQHGPPNPPGYYQPPTGGYQYTQPGYQHPSYPGYQEPSHNPSYPPQYQPGYPNTPHQHYQHPGHPSPIYPPPQYNQPGSQNPNYPPPNYQQPPQPPGSHYPYRQ